MVTDSTVKTLEKMLEDSGALLSGHFLLTSGLHSGNYLQCALLLRYTDYASYAGEKIAEHYSSWNIDVVVSPAIGGIIIGHEVARWLKVPFIFYEREAGEMRLRRFPEPGKKRVLVVEDVITTGSSVKEVGESLLDSGADWISTACIVDRSKGKHVLGQDPFALLQVSFPVYQPSDCPLCRENIPLVKPGSRNFSERNQK